MFWKGNSAVTQFTLVLFGLATIINGKSIESTDGSETKQNPFRLPFLDESKIFRNAKWKFHWPKKLDLPTDENVITKRSTAKDDDVPSPIEPSSAVSLDKMPKTKEDGAKQGEFSSSTNLVGWWAGERLFGVSESFVNPGSVISASIESGLQRLPELVGYLGNVTSPSMTSGAPGQFFGTTNTADHNRTVAQFFGIANVYVGDGHPHVAHDIVTLNVEACESHAPLGRCSASSMSPNGTLFVLYPAASISSFFSKVILEWLFGYVSAAKVRTAIIKIVGSTPATKIMVTCPSVPPGTFVTTQTGSILPYKSRENLGYVLLEVFGSASRTNVAVACIWKSG